MNRSQREFVSAGVGLAGLGAALALHAPLVLMATVPFLLYTGCRLAMPVDPDKTQIILPGDVTAAELETFIGQIKETRDRIVKLVPALPGKLQPLMQEILGVVDDVMADFREDPKDIRLAKPFPDRLRTLEEMLENYIHLQRFQDRSQKATEAVSKTEQALPRILQRLKAWHGKLLDDDAGALSIDARTLDQLMSLD